MADVITVGSRAQGWVTDLPVQAGDQVAKGAVIALIDARAERLRLAEYHAELAAIGIEQQRAIARRSLMVQQAESREEIERAKLSAVQASVDALSHKLKFARAEHERAQKLSRTGVISKNALERVRTEFLSARQDLARAQAEVATAQANLAHAREGKKERKVLDNEVRMLEQKTTRMATRIKRQDLLVEEHSLLSPISGVVSKTFVLPGEYVHLGQRIALIHDPEKIWVEANIRETEIRRLRVGQRVDITADAYPDRSIVGEVMRLGQATTGEFALLPAPNPSGNFTKVTQRLPVKIALVENAHLLKPGMLVEVDIRIDESAQEHPSPVPAK